MRSVVKRLLARGGIEVRRVGRPGRFTETLGLPVIDLATILDGHTAVAVTETAAVDGNTSLTELLVLATLVRRCRPRRLFEIGTFDGRTAVNLIANAPLDAELLTLDLPCADSGTAHALHEAEVKYTQKPQPGLRFAGSEWANRITQLLGDSATFDFDPLAGSCDFVFVDGSHTYDYARNDTQVALRLASPHATIVWHDYQPFWEGVVRCLDELAASLPVGTTLHRIADTSLVVLNRPGHG